MNIDDEVDRLMEVIRGSDLLTDEVSRTESINFLIQLSNRATQLAGEIAHEVMKHGDSEGKRVASKPLGRGVRPKYVDEHFPRWFKFGGWIHPGDKGDVYDGQQEIVNSVSPVLADRLIKARDIFVDRLQAIFDDHPDEFNVYGPPLK